MYLREQDEFLEERNTKLKNKKAIIIFFIIVLVIVAIIGAFEVAKGNELVEKPEIKLPKVSVEKTITDKFVTTYDATGKICNNTYKIGANEVRGKVHQIFVKEGDKVTEGQAVLSINVTASVAQLKLQLVNTTQGLDELNLSLSQLETKRNEMNQLYESGLIAQNTITELDDNIAKLKSKQAGLQRTKSALNTQINDISSLGIVYAKEAGIVTKQKFKVNQTPGMDDCIEIKSEKKPEARIYLTEKIVKMITEDIDVEVDIDGKIYKGFIKDIFSLNPGEALYPVDIEINTEDSFLSDMSISVKIPTYKNDNAVLLNSKAIINFNNEVYVYKLVDNKAVKTLLEVGESVDGFTEVKKGLNAGEEVIVEGQFGISDGDKVEVIK